jgi:hypothetical protein
VAKTGQAPSSRAGLSPSCDHFYPGPLVEPSNPKTGKTIMKQFVKI